MLHAPALRPALSTALFASALIVASLASRAQELILDPLVAGLDAPLFLTHAGDERLFVVERGGTVQVVESSPDPVLLETPFLDIRSRVRAGGEQGLLGLAFHPNYLQNGRLFVYYTNSQGNSVLARFDNPTPGSNQVPASSEAQLLEIEQPFANHNGGMLAFGPDGMLYVGLGDGGSGDDPICAGQRGDTLLGKILRLDVDAGASSAPFHSVPPDNPFVGDPNVLDEVYLTGLRNPWRFSFDRTAGDLFIGDVGQQQREEVSLIPSGSGGQNLGWKMLEGTLCRNQNAGCGGPLPACDSGIYTAPILEYGRGDGVSVTGGYRYRGSEIPQLAGQYLFGDFGSGRIWSARRSGNNWLRTEQPDLRTGSLASFGEDRDGELYVVLLSGEVQAIRTRQVGGDSTFGFTRVEAQAEESAQTVLVEVERSGDLSSAASAVVRTNGGASTATEGEDFEALDTMLDWGAGEGGVRSVELTLLDDAEIENPEEIVVRITNATGGTIDVDRQRLAVTVIDDDVPESCVDSANTLCLRQGRFAVTATFRDFEGTQAEGQRADLTADTGTFFFLEPDNVELVIKVLDGCSINGHYWVFASGLTNVEANVRVVDTAAGAGQQVLFEFENPLGQSFQPVQDTAAFANCP